MGLTRLLCWVGRHRPVTVIDDVDLMSVGPTSVIGRIRAKRRECGRCHKALPS